MLIEWSGNASTIPWNQYNLNSTFSVFVLYVVIYELNITFLHHSYLVKCNMCFCSQTGSVHNYLRKHFSWGFIRSSYFESKLDMDMTPRDAKSLVKIGTHRGNKLITWNLLTYIICWRSLSLFKGNTFLMNKTLLFKFTNFWLFFVCGVNHSHKLRDFWQWKLLFWTKCN